MPKPAISATFSMLALGLALSGCQSFTASEQVSEPNLDSARAARTAIEAAQGAKEGEHGHGHQAHEQARVNPHQQADDSAGTKAADTATASHILIRYVGTMRAGPEVTRSKEAAKKLADEIAGKANASNFAQLADQYTEDPSGKGRGGKLGTFGRGRMVPEFDKATFALQPGQTSGVIETAFGYHIIHREK